MARQAQLQEETKTEKDVKQLTELTKTFSELDRIVQNYEGKLALVPKKNSEIVANTMKELKKLNAVTELEVNRLGKEGDVLGALLKIAK